MTNPTQVFTENKQHIFPWLKSHNGFEPAPPLQPYRDSMVATMDGKEQELDLLALHFYGDLDLFFAYDSPEQDIVTLVRRADLPTAMTEQELLDLAVANLLREIDFSLVDTNFDGAMVTADGNYEVAALLVPHILNYVANTWQDDLHIAAPARDCLFFAATHNTTSSTQMQQIAGNILREEQRPLSKYLFIYEKNTEQLSAGTSLLL